MNIYYRVCKLMKSKATQKRLKDMGGKDDAIPINALCQYKKGTKHTDKHRQTKNSTLVTMLTNTC